MSEAVAYSPSDAFREAALFLSNAPGLAKISNATKLELYGLYKLVTVAAEPQGPRPSLFSPTERAKYDAWKSTALVWKGKRSEAEARYVDVARSLGWTPSSTGTHSPEVSAERTAEELLAEDLDDDNTGSGGSSGMGLSVSIVQRDEVDEEQSLHSIAIKGDVQKLEAYLKSHPDSDVNIVDEYGFTALHLACDRGNAAIVELLLRKGADMYLKDSDELSALDLAREANHEDIAALLENSSRSG